MRSLALVALLAAAPALPGQQNWVQNPENGHWYAVTPAMDWASAERTAVDWGGHLATVRSAAENAWIYEQFCQDSIGGVWIGLNDRAVNGVFAWSSGELATFQAWDEANQHNTAPEESCVHIQGAHHEERYRGKWNDLAENGGWLGGLPGLVEVRENPDTDADGLLDRHEARYGAIVGERDTDGDGLSDGEEVHFFPSWDVAWEMGWEEALGAGHKMPGPAIWSTAGELLGFYPRLVEGMPPHLNPSLADTDGDGLLDGVECGRGPDGERIVDPYTQLTHPLDPDTDGDGLPDGVEDRNGNGRHDLPDETSAVNPDSDGDGLSDGLERGSAAFDRDPLTVTDPNRADSDGGGLPDQAEDFNGDGAIQLGETDPNDPSDDRLRVHLQRDPTTGGVTLGVHGLRRGAWVRVYLAEPAADPEARSTSGNPLALGNGVVLELSGTPLEIWQGLARRDALHLRILTPASQGALQLQVVEIFPNGSTRSSPAIGMPPL